MTTFSFWIHVCDFFFISSSSCSFISVHRLINILFFIFINNHVYKVLFVALCILIKVKIVLFVLCTTWCRFQVVHFHVLVLCFFFFIFFVIIIIIIYFIFLVFVNFLTLNLFVWNKITIDVCMSVDECVSLHFVDFCVCVQLLLNI